MAAEALLSTKKKNMAGQTVTLQNGQKYTMQGASSGVLGTNPGQGISESTKNYQQRGAFETGDPEFARYSSPKEDQIFSGVSTKTGEISASDGKPNNATVPDGTSAMKNSDGTFNATYVPGSMDEIVSANADDYTKQKWLANYYKDNGMDFGKMPDSQMDEANIFVDNADRKQSEMEKQAATAKAEADRQLAESKSANQAQFAQNREGAVSTGNTMSRDAIDLAMQTRYDSRMADLQSQLQDLTFNLQNAKTGFVREQLNNQIKAVQSGIQAAQEAEDRKKKDSMDLLKLYQDSGALANLSPGDIQALQDGLPGLPPNLVSVLAQSATQKSADEKVKNQLTQLNTFADLAGKGIQLPIDSIFQFSKATGLPAETLYATSQLAAQVMQDKNLSIDEKKTKIADMMYDLNLKQKGILTEAGKKTEELRRLYASGAGADTIRAYKQAAGLTDEEDPMYQADLALKKADLAYKESSTAENWASVQKAQREMLSLSGNSSGAYVPSNSLEGITSSYQNGKLDIKCNTPYQCGAFVNRFWGLSAGGAGGMGDSIESKTNLVNTRGVPVNNLNQGNFYSTIKPGMAFVTSYAGTGHTGIVTAVYPDGTFDTMEANVGDNNPNTPDAPRPKNRSIKDANLVGFVYPPSGTPLQGVGANMSLDTSNYENAIRNALQGKAAKTIDSEVQRMNQYFQEGKTDQAKSMILSTISSKFAQADKESFTALNNSLKTLDKVGSEMSSDKIKGKLGMQNNLGPAFAAVGADDQDLRGLDKTIKAEIQQYRKAMSGAAFTESERREYEALFPAITKTPDQNATDIQTLKNVFSQKRDSMLSTATGGAFNSLDEYEDSFKAKELPEVKNEAGLLDFAKQLLHDTHATTGQYALPEDTTSNYTF